MAEVKTTKSVKGQSEEQKDYEFRLLDADEIECRVGQGGKNGQSWCSLLLYKDARCDMKRLDEKFGIYGWQRDHTIIGGNLFCTVSVYKDGIGWVSKQDVGTPSNTEAIKGNASDSFKRACFNLGIGRELYTAPKIFINLSDSYDYKNNGGKFTMVTVFRVAHIGYAKRKISQLIIVDQKGVIRYTYGMSKEAIEQWKQSLVDDTKNPIPAPESNDDSALKEQIQYAYPQILQAQSFDDVDKVWTSYPDLQGVEEFAVRCAVRKMEMSKNKKDLLTIWQQYPALQTNRAFVQKLTEFKSKLA